MTPSNSLRLLIVDDDENLLKAWTRLLGRRYTLTVACGGEEALAVLARTGGSFDAVLIDIGMPDIDGIDVYEGIKEDFPALLGRVGFLTGGAVDDRANDFLASCRCPSLLKPASLSCVDDLVVGLAGGHAVKAA